MTSPDNSLTYSSFCGALLDDMLDQVIFNMISRALFDEKLKRQDYGTISNPIFHDSFLLKEKSKNEVNGKGDDNSINGKKNQDNNGSVNGSGKINLANGNSAKVHSLPTEPDIGRFQFSINGKDIYVNALNDNKKFLGDKASMITVGTAQDTYFKCSNCDRKIAGSRFSAHIDKCLGGRSRK